MSSQSRMFKHHSLIACVRLFRDGVLTERGGEAVSGLMRVGDTLGPAAISWESQVTLVCARDWVWVRLLFTEVPSLN